MERDFLISKAWRGESGDKRNTKYYLAGAAGSAAGLGAVAVAPSSRRIQRVAVQRGTRAASSPSVASESLSFGDIKQGMKRGFKAQYSTPGMKRLTATRAGAGISGSAAGMAAYAAYRKRKRSAS